jgi:hypothetical protein
MIDLVVRRAASREQSEKSGDSPQRRAEYAEILIFTNSPLRPSHVRGKYS